MHVFLTGEVQTGKSTVLQGAVDLLGWPVGGFRSGFGPDRARTERCLYLWDAAGAPVYEQSHAVARFSREGRQPLPQRFDELGCAALRRAGDAGAKLILMDECGYLERDAVRFQGAVLRTLDADVPVLGVVRLHAGGWTDAIRNHPKVKLITVTEENRNGLSAQIARLFRSCIRKQTTPNGREIFSPDKAI